MASKYANLRGKVPAFVEEDSYQSRIEEKKQELLTWFDGDTGNVNRLATTLVKYERDKKALYERYQSKTNDAEYEINLYRTALSQLLVTALGEQGAEEVRLSSGELISLNDKAILVIKDKERIARVGAEEHPRTIDD